MRCSIFSEIDSARLRYYDELFSQNPGLLKPKKKRQNTKEPTIMFKIMDEPILAFEDKPKQVKEEIHHPIPSEEKVIDLEPIMNETTNFANLSGLRKRILDIFFSWFMSGDALEVDQIEHSNA